MNNNKYKAIEKETIDDLIFLSRAISVMIEEDYTEFVFLKPDFITFISIKYYKGGNTTAAEWINRENPYIYLFRNEYGQLQSGIKEE